MKNKTQTIIQGEDKTIPLYLCDDEGYPLDVSAADSVKVIIEKNDGTLLTLETGGLGVALINAQAGHLEFSVTDTQSLTLKDDLHQTIEVEINTGAIKDIHQVKNFLSVIPRIS